MMARRLRREFQALEAQLDYGVQERAWRAWVDKMLYGKGDGPKPIVEQLRLRERLHTLHARRDRYNHKRGAIRLAAFQSLIDQGHLTGAMAVRLGLAEPTEDPLPRGLMIGSMAGDRRLSRKLLL